MTAAQSINRRATDIARAGRRINLATDSVIQLERTNRTARSILASAQPLPPRLGGVIDEAQGIRGVAAAIDGTAGSIDSTAGAIDGSARTIDTTARAIDGTAGRIDGSAGRVDATAGAIHDTAACTDDKLGGPPDGHCRGRPSNGDFGAPDGPDREGTAPLGRPGGPAPMGG